MTLFHVLMAASAAEPTGWTTHGELRELVGVSTDFAVDAEGTTLDQGLHLDQRLRAGFGYRSKVIRFETQWDLMAGQLAGDTWGIKNSGDERHRDIHQALTPQGFQPRKFSLGANLGTLDIEFGLMTSHWGLGLLANDGNHQKLFGREDFGDRVLRFQVTTAPFQSNGKTAPTYLAFIVDTVYFDDTADVWQGQLANQAIVALLHDAGPSAPTWGVYGVYRHQYEKGLVRRTQAGVLDLYGSVPTELGPNLTLSLAAEAVGILGHTARGQTYSSLDGVDIRSGAVVVETTLASPQVDLHLNMGASSGDGNPDDGINSDFTADRDFNVGLVLFDEVLGGIDAGTHRLLTDPQYSGSPPDGVELVATEGAWQHSSYAQIAVTARPFPLARLRLGVLTAFSNSPVSQPFYSFRNGGTPTNHLGKPTGSNRQLGTEIDWSIQLQPVSDEKLKRWILRPRLELQGGHAILGDALGGGTVTLAQATLRLAW